MKNALLWPFVGLILLLPITSWSNSKTLFEGYYKINLNQKHIGYYIQRYQLDQKKKHFVSTYYLRIGPEGGNISESLKARATPSLEPVSYQYTSLQKKMTKTIDASVTGGNMTVKMSENGRLRTFQKKIEKGTFFSTFLIYLILQGKKGIAPGVKYDYKAVAEEDANVLSGTVFIEKEEKYKNLPIFKILNTFKNDQFVNFASAQGASLRSYSPRIGLAAELVATPAEAIGKHTFNKSSLKLLFGDLPAGTKNPIAKNQAQLVPARPGAKKVTSPQLDVNLTSGDPNLKNKKQGTQGQ